MQQHRGSYAAIVALALIASGCRWQSSDSSSVGTGEFGSGSGYTAQCSGDFPDWISSNPPPAGDALKNSFHLAQAYPLGIPVFGTDPAGKTVVDHWDPPSPNQDAPWRAYTNLGNATQRSNYLNALKAYFLEGMSDPGIAFDATKNNAKLGNRRWFHVPMMTAAGSRRREPYHGVTAERGLRPAEQTHWLNGTSLLNAVAIGYYNQLGGYAIGQVFNSYDLSKTDATKAHFIDGSFVFKLLFAQYDPSRIIAPNPLANAPAWFVQNPSNPTAAPYEVRLLQVDVAVKDDHFGATGWVFATYAYDESLAASEPNPWKRLTPIGIQWGNDPGVTGTAPAALAETWINPAMPAAFKDHLGRAGRLVGPVDNPASACMSCHSTAEVDPAQAGNATAYLGATTIPPAGCSDPMDWFRNLPSGSAGATPFGRGNTCPVNTATTGLIATDYSLQLQEGLQSVYGFHNANPCAALAQQYHNQAGDGEAAMMKAMMAERRSVEPILRTVAATQQQVKLKASAELIAPDSDDLHRR
ncbi:MAG: hypothetical protein ACREVL_16450 [Solimonas sp.]